MIENGQTDLLETTFHLQDIGERGKTSNELKFAKIEPAVDKSIKVIDIQSLLTRQI